MYGTSESNIKSKSQIFLDLRPEWTFKTGTVGVVANGWICFFFVLKCAGTRYQVYNCSMSCSIFAMYVLSAGNERLCITSKQARKILEFLKKAGVG